MYRHRSKSQIPEGLTESTVPHEARLTVNTKLTDIEKKSGESVANIRCSIMGTILPSVTSHSPDGPDIFIICFEIPRIDLNILIITETNTNGHND